VLNKCSVDASGSQSGSGAGTGGDGAGGSGGSGAGTGGESGGSGGSGAGTGGEGGHTGGSGAGTGGEGGHTGGSGAGTGGSGGTGGATGGTGGAGGSEPVYDYLECTDGSCCFTDCYGSEICGAPDFVTCANDPENLCGSSDRTVCAGDTATLPAWFAQNECIFYDYEGGVDSEAGYVGLWGVCPCASTANGDIVLVDANFMYEGEEYTCNFASEVAPDCNDELHAECP
jgi:hypothetical protein